MGKRRKGVSTAYCAMKTLAYLLMAELDLTMIVCDRKEFDFPKRNKSADNPELIHQAGIKACTRDLGAYDHTVFITQVTSITFQKT